VIVSPGSKLAIFHALLALLEPGDEALLPDPGYPAYESVATFAGGRPVTYGVQADRADGVDVAEIAGKITKRTRVLILNSPHNPTGRAIGARAIEALAELACRHDLTVISDEIYGRLTFGGGGTPSRSIAAVPGMAGRTVVVDGFSKTYAMTGWRLGYGIMPTPLAAVVSQLLNNSVACTPEFVQMAGIAALAGPQECVTAMVAELRTRRDLLVGGLNAIPGLTCPTPDGAFYVWPDVSKWLADASTTAETLANRLLDEYGVACLAGSAFGHCGGPHLRFSYTTSRQAITTALERIREAVARTA
jgi:aspartate/methionine/tyrosine aminotransferase